MRDTGRCLMTKHLISGFLKLVIRISTPLRPSHNLKQSRTTLLCPKKVVHVKHLVKSLEFRVFFTFRLHTPGRSAPHVRADVRLCQWVKSCTLSVAVRRSHATWRTHWSCVVTGGQSSSWKNIQHECNSERFCALSSFLAGPSLR